MPTPDVAEEEDATRRMPLSAHNPKMRTGDLVVDLGTRVASVHDKPVPLTGKEYGIFEVLSLREGTVVTKEMLLDHLYGGMDEPELKIVDVFICHLRKKLAQATGRPISSCDNWCRESPAPNRAASASIPLRSR